MRSRRMEQQGQNEPANMLSEYECITRPVVAKVSQQTSRERERAGWCSRRSCPTRCSCRWKKQNTNSAALYRSVAVVALCTELELL